MPATPAENESFVTWEGGFTEEELDLAESYFNSLDPDKAIIHGKDKDEEYGEIRRSKTAWVSNGSDIEWFYDRMAYIARQLNAQFYKFDLYGFHEHFQYTIYDSDDKGHYDWHLDGGSMNLPPRKLSLVLQLSNPDDYEGGELQVLAARDPIAVKKERGLVAAFPSYRLHRVTPVIKGVRKTLVAWCCGPAFK